jgi:hypothetical protein
MKRMMRGWVVAVAALAVLSSAPAQAQQVQGTEDGEARAASLENEAKRLSEQKHRWDYAASLYRAAAQLREEGDPQAVHDLVYAGRLAYYTQDITGALRDLIGAAQQALAGGDVIRAAHIYTDAAWVAGKAGRTRDQRYLASRAQRLAESPLLTDDDRFDVLERFDRESIAETLGAPPEQPQPQPQ